MVGNQALRGKPHGDLMPERSNQVTSFLCIGVTLVLSIGVLSLDTKAVVRPDQVDPPSSAGTLVVLCDSLDAYLPLAIEIAEREGTGVRHGIEEAIRLDPAFLLWVCEPVALSEKALTDVGSTIRDCGAPVSVGIITGSSIESAARLYSRRFSFRDLYASVDARVGAITSREGDSTAVIPLDPASLLQTILSTDYLCYSGHGGGGYWRLGHDLFFAAQDLESLPPLIVTSGACQTFRPYEGSSIALAFTEMGACAYAGFLFSPAPYYHFGFPDGFPMMFTYPEFPIGFVIALQNRGSLASYARFPFYFLLGDPRIYFQSGEPYRRARDETDGSERLLRFEDAPKGFVPVLIRGGASYAFVEVEGVTAAGSRDVFYNSKLQYLDFRGDRYVLFDHAGGDFTIRMRRVEPFLWSARDAVTDALDHAFVYLPTTGGDLFLLVVTASVLFVTVVFTVRSRGAVDGFYAALIVGVCVGAWRGLYALLRIERAAVVSTPVQVEPHFVIASLILAGCGALLYFNVRSRLWKMGTVLVMTIPVWPAALAWASGITYVNLAGAIPSLGMPIYNYALSIMPATAFAVECAAVLLLLRVVSRSRS
jgi:hypothetical protein